MTTFLTLLFLFLSMGSCAMLWGNAEEAYEQERWAAFVFNVFFLFIMGSFMFDLIHPYLPQL